MKYSCFILLMTYCCLFSIPGTCNSDQVLEMGTADWQVVTQQSASESSIILQHFHNFPKFNSVLSISYNYLLLPPVTFVQLKLENLGMLWTDWIDYQVIWPVLVTLPISFKHSTNFVLIVREGVGQSGFSCWNMAVHRFEFIVTLKKYFQAFFPVHHSVKPTGIGPHLVFVPISLHILGLWTMQFRMRMLIAMDGDLG